MSSGFSADSVRRAIECLLHTKNVEEKRQANDFLMQLEHTDVFLSISLELTSSSQSADDASIQFVGCQLLYQYIVRKYTSDKQILSREKELNLFLQIVERIFGHSTKVSNSFSAICTKLAACLAGLLARVKYAHTVTEVLSQLTYAEDQQCYKIPSIKVVKDGAPPEILATDVFLPTNIVLEVFISLPEQLEQVSPMGPDPKESRRAKEILNHGHTIMGILARHVASARSESEAKASVLALSNWSRRIHVSIFAYESVRLAMAQELKDATQAVFRFFNEGVERKNQNESDILCDVIDCYVDGLSSSPICGELWNPKGQNLFQTQEGNALEQLLLFIRDNVSGFCKWSEVYNLRSQKAVTKKIKIWKK